MLRASCSGGSLHCSWPPGRPFESPCFPSLTRLSHGRSLLLSVPQSLLLKRKRTLHPPSQEDAAAVLVARERAAPAASRLLSRPTALDQAEPSRRAEPRRVAAAALAALALAAAAAEPAASAAEPLPPQSSPAMTCRTLDDVSRGLERDYGTVL